MHDFAIKCLTVIETAMFAKLLSVVGHKHDERVIIKTQSAQFVHQDTETVIVVRDLCIVEAPHPLGTLACPFTFIGACVDGIDRNVLRHPKAIVLGGSVGAVRVHRMNVQQERLPLVVLNEP